MINVKKGTAHSLQQVDIRGGNPGAPFGTSGATVLTAGSIAHVDATSGNVTLGGTGANGLRGFTINNSYDGDALESGKIAMYTLDGQSVIETDQVDLAGDTVAAINLTNYPVGTPLYASTTTLGLVGKIPNGNGVIGWVEGVRNLQNATPYPSGITQSAQNYPRLLESDGGTPVTKSFAFKAQVNVPVLGIKLASSN
jgi:hypothetical protein